uniref:Squalene epoxidase domain-containing protein n=1 Tax=Brassica oleracea var. oleracea TaxID=109376 RepID=A0A0D3DYA5_BRAOL
MKVVPTKSMSATLSEKKGVIVLGDAFNMRHPLIASVLECLNNKAIARTYICLGSAKLERCKNFRKLTISGNQQDEYAK